MTMLCNVVQEFLLSLWQSWFANEVEQINVQKRHESANLNV